MFDELKDTEPQEPEPEEDKVTGVEALFVYFMILLLALLSIIAFINLEGHRHGLQIATMLSYSGGVFIWTFLRTRGVTNRYPLDEPYVQEQLPKLLGIHCLFLVCVDGFESSAFALSRDLSPWWFTASSRKDIPPFQLCLMLCIGAIGIMQVMLSRRILYRAKQQERLLQKEGA